MTLNYAYLPAVCNDDSHDTGEREVSVVPVVSCPVDSNIATISTSESKEKQECYGML